MYDFSQHLEVDEKIIYQGQSFHGKGNNGIKEFFIVKIVALVVDIPLFIMIFFPSYSNADILTYIFFSLFSVFFNYTAIYQIYYARKKRKQLANNFYCLTNQRAIKYDYNNNEIFFGSLRQYEDVRCYRVKDGYGDLYMGIILENGGSTGEELSTATKMLKDPDSTDMPYMEFTSIKDPESVKNLIIKVRQDILNKEI